MNYERYYNDIINNAKKRKTNTGYVENHHIIPRSLGGLDDSSNIVPLTGKEHYIVHHLLYKIHENNISYGANVKMAQAWYCMANIDGAASSNHKDRYIVSAIKYEKLKELNSYLQSDNTVYDFTHKTGIDISCTRKELIDYTNNENYRYNSLDKSLIHAVVNGSIMWGWCLKDKIPDDFYWEKYTLTNNIETVTDFAYNLQRTIKIGLKEINLMKSKQIGTVYGYRLIGINGIEFIGKPDRVYETADGAPSFNSIICKWMHPEHGIEYCTMFDLTKKYNLIRTAVSGLFYGRQKSHFGWTIHEKDGVSFTYTPKPPKLETKASITKFNAANLVRKWNHSTHGIEYLTVNDLVEKYSLPRAQIHDIVDGTQLTSHGWTYLGDVPNKP